MPLEARVKRNSNSSYRKSLRILLLDDEQMLLDLYSHVLGSQGYEVVTAASVAEALGALERLNGSVDALVVDVRLPDGNGVEFVHAAEAKYGRRPTLFITGAAEGVPQLASEESDWRVLYKPISVPDLLRYVSALG